MTAKNTVTAIDRGLDANGDQKIEVTCADGKVIEVAIDLDTAQVLVQVLQDQLVDWAHKSAKDLSLAELSVSRMDVAHQGMDAQLVATMPQIGVVVLLMSDDTLRQTRHEIDRVLAYRSTPTTTH
jgi:hypothetical protein